MLTSRRKRVVGVDFGIAHANPTVWARGIAFERANTRWGLTHRRRLRSVPVSGADAPPPTRTSPMSDPDEELRKAVALFRYGLIADVLRLPPGSRENPAHPAREGPAHLHHPRHAPHPPWPGRRCATG